MAGTSYEQYSSRIADDARTWQAACQGDVTGWDKANDVILAMIITTAAHTPAAESFTLQYSPDGGTNWYDVGTTGDIRYKDLAELVDGNPIAGPDQSGCAGTPLDYTEEVEDAVTGTVQIDKNDFAEFHFGLDISNAEDGTTYSFRLWSNANGGTPLAAAAAELTTESGVTQYTIEATIDSRLVSRLTKDSTIDSRIVSRETEETTVDGRLISRKTEDTTIDSRTVSREKLDTTLDARLVARWLLDTSIDALIKEKNKTVDATIDAFIQEKNKTLDTTIDAFIQLRGKLDTTIDAILKAKGKKIDVTIDSRLVNRLIAETSIDSWTVERKIIQTSIDGRTVDRKTAESSIDGYIISRKTEDTTIDAIIVYRLESTTIIDSLLRSRKTVSATIDAHVGSLWKGIIQIAMTLKERNIDLTLKEREIDLSLKERGISIKLVGEDMPNIGDTFQVDADLKDFDGSPLTPDSQEVTLYDAEGNLKDTDSTPTGDAGSYTAKLTAPEDSDEGVWKVVWKATKAGEAKSEKTFIEVKAV